MQSVPTAEVPPCHPPNTSSTADLSSEYDFIIIGGGTSGLLLAFRLSEDHNVQVLVLEAGANRIDDPKITTPGLLGMTYDDPNYDWCFQTVPQKELNGRQIPQNRGKVLGGSSAIYHLQMVYGSPSVFDAWGKIGNPGWSWKSTLPYLRKSHTFNPPSSDEMVYEISKLALQDEAESSREGPIQLSYSEAGEVDKAWYEAWTTIMSDMNYEGDHLGGYIIPNAIDPETRTRSYAGSAFYSKETSSRPNLRVITEAIVEKIILQKRSEVAASGVQFISSSRERITIVAKKEVILSAGVIQSPQMLELSGIGCATLLKTHGIECLIDNPNVGENLQDHACGAVSFEVADGVQSADGVLRNPEIFKSLLEMYQKDASGPLGHLFVDYAEMRLPEIFSPDGKSFLSSLLSQHPPHDPKSKVVEDVMLDLLSQEDSATAHHFMAKSQFNIAGETKITNIMKPRSEGNFFTLLTSLNHPFSRGSIHISSPSSSEPPIIDPKYLSHPLDLEILARHVQFFSNILSTHPLTQYFKTNGRRLPAFAFSKGFQEPSLDEAKRIVRETLISNYHPAGTCMMAPREKGGVVDERLRVHGVKNLRVVDASIFPLVPRGNVITSVYAVAEKAADMLREDWRGR